MVMPSQPFGHRALSEIAKDYTRAEITALWVHEPASKRHILAFAVAELCPPEQEPSALFSSGVDKAGKPVRMERAELSSDRKAYVTRILLDDPHGAVDFYRGQGGSWPLPEPCQMVRLEALGPLEELPRSEIPMLVTGSGGSESPGAVLPRREGTLRLYSRLEPKGLLGRYLQPRELEALGEFALEKLGVDLLRFSEYQGAVLLCAPNPLLRDMEEWISSDERHFVVEFRERDRCSIRGCTFEITELLDSEEGFTLRSPVTDSQLVIPIPHRPSSLRTRLLDPSGECIHDSSGFFPGSDSFRIDGRLGGHIRDFKIHLRDGTVEHCRIETVSATRFQQAERERDASQLLREARERRELEDLERNRTFVYFEGGAASKRRATEIIRELLGNARHRCIICDSYLSADDVARFAPFVRVTHLPIQLLGARFFLKQKLQKGTERTEGDLLLERLRAMSALDASLVLSCRVMRGSQKSPVHDRFLVIDDDVYLLGSSLNEFGSRATTLFRIPDPQRIIDELISWWSDPQRTFPLEELRGMKPLPGEEDEPVD